MGAWLLQANPARYRLMDLIADGGELTSWTVKRYLDAPQPGDGVALWLSGHSGGLVGVGRVSGAVEASAGGPADPYWSDPSRLEGAHVLPISMDQYLVPCIPRRVLADDPRFAGSAIFRAPQSANPFPLSDDEWAALEDQLDREPPTVAGWHLRPGDTIRRVDLHARYGGGRQSGISSSSQSPNIMIFTDAQSGAALGYEDTWLGDDVFLYAGAGQRDDQEMKGANLALARHVDTGRSLRVFQGARGTVRYLGEFAVDPSAPYTTVRARQRDSSATRTVIQFRLLRLASQTSLKPAALPPAGLPYSALDEEVRIAATAAVTAANPDLVGRGLRTHHALQNHLAAQLAEAGYEPLRPAPHDPDFDLAWTHSPSQFAVVEVKSLSRLNEVRQLRMGLGQVLDYESSLSKRFESVTPVLYVERAPVDQARWTAIAQKCGVVLAWPGQHTGLPGLTA